MPPPKCWTGTVFTQNCHHIPPNTKNWWHLHPIRWHLPQRVRSLSLGRPGTTPQPPHTHAQISLHLSSLIFFKTHIKGVGGFIFKHYQCISIINFIIAIPSLILCCTLEVKLPWTPCFQHTGFFLDIHTIVSIYLTQVILPWFNWPTFCSCDDCYCWSM